MSSRELSVRQMAGFGALAKVNPALAKRFEDAAFKAHAVKAVAEGAQEAVEKICDTLDIITEVDEAGFEIEINSEDGYNLTLEGKVSR